MHIELAVFDLIFLQQEEPCENEIHGIMFSYYQCIALVLDQNSLGNLRIYFCTLALWKRVYIHIHIVKLEENENTIIFGLCCRNVP